MKIKFTKIFAVVLCLSLILTGITVAAAEKAEAYAKEIDILNQLGVLDVTAENANLTKQTVISGMNAIMGNNAPQMVYFEKHEPTDSLNYGQAVMVLVDALGYANYVEMLGFDPQLPESYINTAKRIKLVPGAGKAAGDLVTIGEWADLLFEALTKIPIMRPMLYRQSIVYDIDDDSTMLSEYMNIEVIEGVVKGVDSVSTIISDGTGEKRLKLGNVWYNHSFDRDMYKYFGYYAAGYINTDTKELRAVAIDDRENEVVEVNAEDIKAAASKTTLTYYDSNDKTRTLKISTEADFIYNRELVTDYVAADLNIEDCDYILIDNNDDGFVDIIRAEKYTSFVVGSRQIAEQRILDTDGTVYEMEKFFTDGGKLYDENGRLFKFEDLQSYDTISCLRTRSGKMAYVTAVDKKLDAVYNGNREGGKYIKLDGVEYKTTEDYRNGNKLDMVKTGDVVMAFLDIKGSIADMRYVDKGEKAAYLMQAAQGVFDTVTFKILDEDSKVKVVEVSGDIELDGRKINAGELLSQPEFLVKGAFSPQLVKYKQNKNGVITAIDTAKNVNKMGNRSNDEFTLNYDSSLTVLSYKPNAETNGVILAGSKYVLNEAAKLFLIVTDADGNYREDECLVQSGKAVPTNQNPNLKLYNVNDNYEPEYIVMTTSWEYEEWVDNWGQAYMIDEISESLDEFGEPAYKIKIIDSEGNGDFWSASRVDLASPGEEGWSASWSPDQSDWKVTLGELPRGSLLHVQRNGVDLKSIAVHHIPKKKNIYFERQSGSLDEFGLSEYVFNGTYTMCYGEVIRKTDAGYIINCHEPTDDEKAAGAVYPMPEWNRHMPMSPQQTVVIYDRERDIAYRDVAGNIVPGDNIFIKRDRATYNGIYVYR